MESVLRPTNDIDFDSLRDRDSVLMTRDLLVDDVTSIKAQLSYARAQKKKDGTNYDPVWYARAEQALRIKNKQIQRLEMIAAEFKRKEQVAYNSRMENLFIRVAKDALAPEVFFELINKARMLGETEREGFS
jgi:hypothetical protein